MKITTRFQRITFLTVISVGHFWGQSQPNGRSNIELIPKSQFLKVEVDQDFFNAKMNDDRDYTMGLSVQYGFNSRQFNQFREDWSSRLSLFKQNRENHIPFLYTCTRKSAQSYYLNTQYSIILRGMAFTPDNIKTQLIQTGDRPFAGVTTLGLSRSTLILSAIDDVILFNHSENKDNCRGKGTVRQSSFNLALGFIGTNFYQNLQGGIHSLSNKTYKDTINGVNPFYPYGWVNQISPKGRFTGSMQYSMNWLLTKKYFLKTYEKPVNKKGYAEGEIQRLPWYQRRIECSVNTGASIGYYNALSTNFQVRFGKINPLKWMNSLNTLNNSNYTSSITHKRHIADNFKGIEFFGYINAGGHWMIYNALLQGQLLSRLQNIEDTYVVPRDQVRPLFADINIGIGISTNRFQLYYAPYVKRTSEVKLVSIYQRNQYWGKVGLYINLNCTKK